jgi:hypothetical protein
MNLYVVKIKSQFSHFEESLRAESLAKYARLWQALMLTKKEVFP